MWRKNESQENPTAISNFFPLTFAIAKFFPQH